MTNGQANQAVHKRRSNTLSFAEFVNSIERLLNGAGWRRPGGEVFLRGESIETTYMLGLSGTDFSYRPVLGVCNRKVDNIANEAAKRTLPGFTPLGPVPLFRVTPEDISPEDAGFFGPRAGKQGYEDNDIALFAQWLDGVGVPYLRRHVTLDASLALALARNKFDQAQTYYIPALMKLLNKDADKDSYVRQVVEAFPPEASAVKDFYATYLKNLEEVFSGR